MERLVLPCGWYRIVVPTPEQREAFGDDLTTVWADVFSEGAETCCATVQLGEAEGDEMSGFPPVFSRMARTAWEGLLDSLEQSGAVVVREVDTNAIAAARVNVH